MKPITDINHRNEFGAWLQANNISGVGVEVGSLCGEFAKRVLTDWTLGTLVMVDPWEKQPDDVYKDKTNESDFDSAYKSCELIRDEFKDRCFLHRAYSPAAANEYRDGELAWIYLDGNHCLSAITADLNAWFKKVRVGGIMAGHDMRVQRDETQICEVRPAVEKFCVDNGLNYHHSKGEGCDSWWIIIPEKPRLVAEKIELFEEDRECQ